MPRLASARAKRTEGKRRIVSPAPGRDACAGASGMGPEAQAGCYGAGEAEDNETKDR